ncbi:acetyl-CoA carboxylase biotin carboxyl carrier protein [Thermus thermamylovorans]|uniref:Biotin carboxyl carrier protein of acetyl-CoA carboxylase n=1 Tax=Thermus thermamylovorans TaxID=2509362 RepID=A0A4Q9BA39_9DEIN|nr:acetyl-CoA carboxylase biotin carboxyl carrier protein [Thermus thermamylovorans]TBH21893.1 acetyl-CoA carboxylase biotin carboxyl carrier protein [Thermus thermamylovorans]
MTPKELKQILQALVEHGVNELTLETPDYKLTVRRGGEVQVVAVPQAVPSLPHPPAPVAPPPPEAPPAPPPAPAEAPGKEGSGREGECAGCVEVRAPIVGTFYRAPAPDAPPYVKEGDRVERGQVLCIIEAMKLMNEIESEVSGIVRKILVQNGEPVEYGQSLFLIQPV